VLIWVATERASYLAVGTAMFAAGAYLAFSVFAPVQGGFDTWTTPWEKAKGFQVVQAPFAFADGGVAGRGLNLGVPTKIPVVESDMIFAAIGEELGLLGAAAVLIGFVLMIGAGLRIAQQAASGFERLLATGLTTLLGFQAFIIMAGVV